MCQHPLLCTRYPLLCTRHPLLCSRPLLCASTPYCVPGTPNYVLAPSTVHQVPPTVRQAPYYVLGPPYYVPAPPTVHQAFTETPTLHWALAGHRLGAGEEPAVWEHPVSHKLWNSLAREAGSEEVSKPAQARKGRRAKTGSACLLTPASLLPPQPSKPTWW